MSMLTRYKKNSAATMELVKLVEESAEPKRSNLMNMIRQEDAEFAAKIEKRLFDYNKFRALEEGLVAEIISACPPKTIALAMYGESEDFLKLVERCLGNKFSEYKSEKEVFAEKVPPEAQIDSARRKIVSEARKLEADGAIRLMDYDKLDSGGDAAGAASSVMSGANAGPTGTASADAGIPSVESFAMEAPPPGMIGERFEAFVKKELGIK